MEHSNGAGLGRKIRLGEGPKSARSARGSVQVWHVKRVRATACGELRDPEFVSRLRLAERVGASRVDAGILGVTLLTGTVASHTGQSSIHHQ